MPAGCEKAATKARQKYQHKRKEAEASEMTLTPLFLSNPIGNMVGAGNRLNGWLQLAKTLSVLNWGGGDCCRANCIVCPFGT